MNADAIPAAIVFGTVAAVGTRSTFRLWLKYRAIAGWISPPNRLLGRAFVIVSLMVMVAIGWFGFLTVRRLLGYDPIEWSQIVSYLVSLPVLLVPTFFEVVWARVGR